MSVSLRPTTPEDLSLVLEIEDDPEVAPWVTQWPAERHLQAIKDADEAHLLVTVGGDRVGFVLLAGLQRADGVVELGRIALARRDGGIGRQALAQAVALAFNDHGARRVWLDVMPENLRARHLYESSGFLSDGLVSAGHPSLVSEPPLLVMSTQRDDWLSESVTGLTPRSG